MCKRLMFAFLVVAGLALVGGTAHADQIYVCQSCTASPGGEPNPITDTGGFNMGFDGNHTSLAPLVIIVGSYDGAAAPTVSFGSNTYSPINAGVTFNASDGSEDAYTVLGLSPADNSEQFGNWNLGETKNGIADATSFTLYEYELSGVTLSGPNSPTTFDLEGATNGSYVLGFGCEEGTVDDCDAAGSTPFTNAGLVDASVPEPETLSMLALGLGLVGLLGFRRRRVVNFAN